MDGLSIKAFDKPTGTWIGAVSLDSGDFSQDTPSSNRQRVSEAILEAVYKGHGFNPQAKLTLRTHANWTDLESALRKSASTGLVAS